MKLKDVKVGQRFGFEFEKTAAYFGRDAAMVWTRISVDTIQMDGMPPEEIGPGEEDVFVED